MKILFFANTEWYLYNFRLGLARYLRAAGHEVVMVSPPGKYGPRLEAEGFRWIPVDMQRRSFNPLREGRLVHQLAQVYRREQPAIAHHFTLKCVIYGSLAARLAGVPRVVNAIAGLGYVFASTRLRTRLLLRPAVRQLLRLVCSRKGSAVIVQNPVDKGFVRGLGLPPQVRVALIPGSGVDTTRFAPASKPSAQPGAPVTVLFVGRLLYDKGIRDFVEMAARCTHAGNRAVRYMVAGDPDPGNPVSVSPEELARWKARGSIDFLGHVGDMPGLLATADIVVLPSRTEGAPRSLIEAAASAVPIVATDIPGCREVVTDGSNGFLVPWNDVDALTAAVQRLAEDDALRLRMGAAGRQLALRKLDEQIVCARTRDVYRSILAPRAQVVVPSSARGRTGTRAPVRPVDDLASSGPQTDIVPRRA